MMHPERMDDYLQRLDPIGAQQPADRARATGSLRRVNARFRGDSGKLRAEFRKGETDKSEHTNVRVAHPSRYFFMPLEPLLVNGDPEHANSGRICVARWLPIWEWITRDCCRRCARLHQPDDGV